MHDSWAEDILRFWFEELPREAWFRKDETVDAAIRARFGALHERLAQDLPPAATTTPEGALAAIVLFDQFPRNMFRGTPRAFASDGLALRLAEKAIAHCFDQQIAPERRLFFYLPFEHAEDRAAQARSLELFTALGDPALIPYAREHKEIIDRFGRFPHRNAILGRPSTPEETEFLKTHSGF